MTQTLMLILEKIGSKDRDFRYMATSDLQTELIQGKFKTDPETERKLCTALVNQLDDAGDISGLAVKCLGLLIRKVGELRAEDTIKVLCDKVVNVSTSNKQQQRDIASIALKTVISDIPGGNLAITGSAIIANKMLEAVGKDSSDAVGDALDILTEVLLKFGSLLGSLLGAIQVALLSLLDDPRAAVRKRAMHCTGALSMFLPDAPLASLVQSLLQRLQQPGLKPDMVHIYVQAMGQVSRAVGYRFGPFLGAAVPLLVKYCDGAAEGGEELREACLQSLEGMVLRGPHDARAQLGTLLALGLRGLKYDPNYASDGEDEELAGEEDDEEDGQGGSDDDAYSDDEEQSWKVRRAAAKLLSALASSYVDAIPQVYGSAATELVSRFKEREENVKVDVFATFVVLARQVAAAAKRFAPDDPESPLAKLSADVPHVLRGLSRTLLAKNPKTKVAAFSLLRELAAVVPGPVAEQLPLMLPGITAALADKSSAASSLKVEALLFSRSVLGSGLQGSGAAGSATRIKQLQQLAQAVIPCAQERYFKITAEALRAMEALLLVMRPAGAEPAALPAELQALVPQLFKVLQARLAAQDQDQEVKDAAISVTATALAQAGDVLASEVPSVLKLLLERLRNEVTRLTAVRAFGHLAASPLVPQLSAPSLLEPLVAELTSFLRKALRPLRQASLVTLEQLASRCGSQLSPSSATLLASEASSLVLDKDQPLAALALKTLATLTCSQPGNAAPAVAAKALPVSLDLLRSALLQAQTLLALQAFFAALAASGSPALAPDQLLQQLMEVGRAGAGSGASQPAVAQCVAALACAAGPAKVMDTAQRLLADLVPGADVARQRLALLCHGHIGRRCDLSSLPQVEAAISSSLASPSEEVKSAASLALGGITCGNLQHYMPSLVERISGASGNAKQQYLLLTALAEVLGTVAAAPYQTPASEASAGQPLAPSLPPGEEGRVLSLLLGCVPGGQEECRTVVSECLGRLAQLNPGPMLQQLAGRLQDPCPEMRAVVVSAVKYMAVDRPHAVDSPLATCVQRFLSLMNDPDRHVRRAAVVSLSAVAHQKPSLVAHGGVLAALLPLLYGQTSVQESLIRVVDLGPFKHKMDDGLELRKSAFECLDILADSPACRPQLDLPVFLTHLKSGLGDHADVKATCHLIVTKLAAAEPAALLSGAELLVPPLEQTLTTKLKGEAVKQEVDRHEDMLRSCLRAVDALAALPGITACGPFALFMRRTVLVPPIRDKFAQVERERLEAEGGAVAVDSMEM